MAALDAKLRVFGYWEIQVGAWARLKPAELPNLAKSAASRSSIAGLATFHENGHVREAAVRYLNEIDDGSEVPFLLLRLKDWVDPVRDAAIAAIQRRLTPSRLGHFVRNIYIIFRLTEWKRAGRDDVVRWLMGQLVEEQNQQTLRSLLESPDALIRRPAFRLALEIGGENCKCLVLAGLKSEDVVLRVRAARHVRQSFQQGELIEILPLMEQDKSMPVRREALLTRLDRQPESAAFWLEKALLDRHASMRELARFYLRRSGRSEFADVYRQALAEDLKNSVALAGLGENGTNADIPLVRPFLCSRITRERVAAVRAFASLGGEEVRDELMVMLPDDKTRVTLAAAKGLENHLDAVSPSMLWARFGGDTRTHVRRALLDLSSQMGGWSSLPVLIRLAADSDTALAERARLLVMGRLNQVFTTPTSVDREQIRQAVAEMKGRLTEQFLKELNARLKGRGI